MKSYQLSGHILQQSLGTNGHLENQIAFVLAAVGQSMRNQCMGILTGLPRFRKHIPRLCWRMLCTDDGHRICLLSCTSN